MRPVAKSILAIWVLIVFAQLTVYAQIQIQQLPQNQAGFSAKDAFNLVLVNTGQPFKGVLDAKIISLPDGELVAQLSGQVFLQSGMTTVTPQSVKLSKSEYLSQSFREHEEIYFSLPNGAYRVCVRLRCESPDCYRVVSDNLFESCYSYTANNYVPLVLASPAHDSKLDEQKPTFSWLPIPGNFRALQYKIKLVEIQEQQSPESAIQENQPKFEFKVPYTTAQFPADLPQLDEGKRYAWQVIGFINKKPISNSPVWLFSITPSELPTANSFSLLQNSPPSSYIEVHDKKVYFQFNEKYNSVPLECRIYNILETKVTYNLADVSQLDTFNTDELQYSPVQSFKTREGANKYVLDLSKEDLAPDFYMLEAKDARGEKYYLRFRIR